MIEINGAAYFSASDVVEFTGISRQTLWRWRRGGKVPQGRRYRGREIIFSSVELDRIREFANRVDGVDLPDSQLSLFSYSKRR